MVVLGHGAGGDSSAPVLQAVASALVDAGAAVALVDQPYRVAGRRAPDPAPRLDAALRAVVTHLRRRRGMGTLPLVLGGKSSGARVACRTAEGVGASGVLALGFPLHPPRRPERSRAAELAAVACPVLVVQGERDSFGTPEELAAALGSRPSRGAVHVVCGGDHSFVPRKADGRTREECLAEVAEAAARWLSATY